jgi:hypothetical protein
MRFCHVLQAVPLCCAFLICVSCASAQKAETNEKTNTDVSETVPSEPKNEVIKVNRLKLYEDKTGDVKISIVSAPKSTVKGKPFAVPFKVKAVHADGTPAAGFEITAYYPGDAANDEITFASALLKTAEDGTASFEPEAPSKSVKSIVRFYPAFDDADEEVASAQLKAAVTAPWLVKTNLMKSGGSTALVDLSENDKPITNNSVSSSKLLTSLMRDGFTRIGNADFTKQIVSGDKDAVYKSACSLFGNALSYLIYGTVKFVTPVTQTETGWTCTLTADITCLNMKDGCILYHTTRTVTAEDSKQWNVLTKTREALGEELADAVVYGM